LTIEKSVGKGKEREKRIFRIPRFWVRSRGLITLFHKGRILLESLSSGGNSIQNGNVIATCPKKSQKQQNRRPGRCFKLSGYQFLCAFVLLFGQYFDLFAYLRKNLFLIFQPCFYSLIFLLSSAQVAEALPSFAGPKEGSKKRAWESLTVRCAPYAGLSQQGPNKCDTEGVHSAPVE
jgi:hypothetical protein